MMKRIFLFPLALGGMLVVAALLYSGFQSPQYSIVREREIDALPEVLFQQIGDLRNWKTWSPWQINDPEMKVIYSGAEKGIGSKFSWTSPKSGAGELEVTEYLENSRIGYLLTFKDWESVSTGSIELTPTGPNRTRVTWKMLGKNRFTERLLWLVFRFQKSIEKDFDQGLQLIENSLKLNKLPH